MKSASIVTAPVDTAPTRLSARVEFAAVVRAPDVPALTVTSVPVKFNVDNAPELTVAAPTLTRDTVVIVPAAVVQAAFLSVTATDPPSIPIRPSPALLTSATNADCVTVAAVVLESPVIEIALLT